MQPQLCFTLQVVIVGDVPDVTAVVDLVRAAFEGGGCRDATPPLPIPTYHHVPHDQPRYQVFVDREAQSPAVYVSFKHPRQRLATPAEFLAHLEVRVSCVVSSLSYYYIIII
jgi:hypothetical protein